jgi:hypothetical protein
MVGSVARASRSTDVAAPVRSELNTASDWAVTVTSSVTEAALRLRLTSAPTPSVTNTFFAVFGWKPAKEAVTLYGPPTLMPGMS